MRDARAGAGGIRNAFPPKPGSCAELDLFPTPLLGEAFERNNDSPAPLGNLPSL